jgi:Gas vesicle synthesis protein GvpL/GvpF
MRLATVYHDDRGVLAMLTGHEEEFRACFERIAGRLELGVKAFAVRTERPESAPASSGEPPSGAAYLARRRSQISDAEDVRRAAAAQADSVHVGLARLAVLADLHPPQDPQLSGDRATMVLNGTYLVEAEEAGRFAAAVQEAEREHPALRLELTGPWPPYSFATFETGSVS